MTIFTSWSLNRTDQDQDLLFSSVYVSLAFNLFWHQLQMSRIEKIILRISYKKYQFLAAAVVFY